MTLASGIDIPSDRIGEICRRYKIREMSVFGSAARGDMREDSGIDIMVVFDPDARPGWDYFGIADELANLLGRPVDFGTKDSLKPDAKPTALRDAVVIYAE